MPLPACPGWQGWVEEIRLANFMKLKSLPIVAAVAALLTTSLHAQEPNQAELEAKFKEMMTGVTMSGRWCSLKDGVLGEQKNEKYTIVSAEKGNGDAWIINAKMRYGGQEIVAPIPVQVKWAGDAAVMVVDALKIPGPNGSSGNSYSARVLFYDNTYAGTWSGGNHAGLLKGVIVKNTGAK